MRGEEALTSREINPVLQGNAIKFSFENEYLKDLEAIAKKRASRARTLVGDDDRVALPLSKRKIAPATFSKFGFVEATADPKCLCLNQPFVATLQGLAR
jgi:hypothetical protein